MWENLSILPDVIYQGKKSIDTGNDVQKFELGVERMQNHYAIDVKASASKFPWLLCDKHRFDRIDTKAFVFCSLKGVPQTLRKSGVFLRQSCLPTTINGFIFTEEDLIDESGTPRFFLIKGIAFLNPKCLKSALLRGQQLPMSVKQSRPYATMIFSISWEV